MGFEVRESVKYVKIADGVMYYKVNEGESGAVKINWEHKGDSGTYYRKEFGGFTGNIIDMKYDVSEEYKTTTLNVKMKDLDEVIILQINAASQLHSGLLNSLANCDLSAPVRIDVSKGKKGGSSLWIKQAGEDIKWKFNKENPGPPMATKKMVQGKESWDWSDVYEWWYQFCMKEIIPQVSDTSHDIDSPVTPKAEVNTIEEPKTEAEPPVDDESDNLPF